MSHPPTDRPTDPTDRPTPYYQYRLTVPHAREREVREYVEEYSKDWAYCMHHPDDEDKKEHFHMVFRDFDQSAVDRFRKRLVKHFEQSGNALHSGKFQSNHISKAIGYFKHDEHAEIVHSGQAYWQEYVDTEPAFVKTDKPGKVLKEKMSHPLLTYGNVLKQALKYHRENNLRTCLLSDVIEEMVHTENWWASRELITNGIPSETHQRFSDMVQSKRSKFSFWLPHERSEKKLEWVDKVATGWYPSGVSSSGPGNSQKRWADKDFRDPSSI